MHLVDGLRIDKSNDMVCLMDGEDKPIIDTNGNCNIELLEEFIWIYKRVVENYQGKYEDMFIGTRKQ